MTASPLLILTHTPIWVWGLLALLVVLGARQLADREVPLRQLLLLPLGLGGWSLYSALHAFAPEGAAVVLAAWLAGAALGAASNAVLRLPRGCADNGDGSYHVAGSVAPLLLMLGVFCTRYVNGVALAMQPGLAASAAYALAASAVFGLPAGLLAARAWRVMSSARRAALSTPWGSSPST